MLIIRAKIKKINSLLLFFSYNLRMQKDILLLCNLS